MEDFSSSFSGSPKSLRSIPVGPDFGVQRRESLTPFIHATISFLVFLPMCSRRRGCNSRAFLDSIWRGQAFICAPCSDRLTISHLHGLDLFRAAVSSGTGQRAQTCVLVCMCAPHLNLGSVSLPPALSQPAEFLICLRTIKSIAVVFPHPFHSTLFLHSYSI